MDGAFPIPNCPNINSEEEGEVEGGDVAEGAEHRQRATEAEAFGELVDEGAALTSSPFHNR